jgi:hypothetical protein
VSRAPTNPRSKKAPEPDAGAPKPIPRKRSPKRAVAVKAGVADAAPVKLRGTTRKAMVKAHRELHEAIKQAEKPSMETWEETHFPYDEPDYVAENARNRRAAADTWITIATVFGVIVIIGLMAWWVG